MNIKTVQRIMSGVLFTLAITVWAEHEIRIEHANKLEEDLTIQAYREVKAYYKRLGFSMPDDIRPAIIFQDQITINGEVRPDNVGLFDPETTSIRLIHFESQKFQQLHYLGIEATSDIYYSLIVHELAHCLNAFVSPGLTYAANELIAGNVQMELMDPETRERILSIGGEIMLSSYRDVSLSAYHNYGPQNYILASYGYCKEHPKMLLRFLNQKVPEIKDPFLLH